MTLLFFCPKYSGGHSDPPLQFGNPKNVEEAFHRLPLYKPRK